VGAVPPAQPSSSPHPSVGAVVFDLGGVVLDLAGLRAFLDRHDLDLGEFFRRALGSGAHHAFERGDLTTDEYAVAFLAEAGLDLDPTEFLVEFAEWPGALLPGAAELVADIPPTVVTATLSNTNPVHWTSEFNETTVLPMFQRHFPSYQLGLAKPDPAIFESVVRELDLPAGRVVFLDDNQANVDSAAAVGLLAARVDGPAEARAVLAELDLVRANVVS
jgi:putative hydrolase of the HAD superfamily